MASCLTCPLRHLHRGKRSFLIESCLTCSLGRQRRVLTPRSIKKKKKKKFRGFVLLQLWPGRSGFGGGEVVFEDADTEQTQAAECCYGLYGNNECAPFIQTLEARIMKGHRERKLFYKITNQIWQRQVHVNNAISRFLELLLLYENDSNVKLVIVKGKGRAFSAGGDVTSSVRYINSGKWKSVAVFFWKNYTLDYLIATYSKPQVSILNGIVMGGGAGCSIHGSFRVATENSVFAMPETALGLFPDIGASYFLSRLPGHFGEYLGLTGARLDGAEMLVCGLATHFVPSPKLPSLEAALHTVDSSDQAVISAIIGKYSELPTLKEQSAYHRLDVINRCFSRRTVEDILSALEREAANKVDGWILASIQSLKKASPTSLKISLRSIREGQLQGVGQCLVREYIMACHVIRGEVSKDFLEGSRAILVDKDRNPKWEPPRLELLSDKMVDKYFSKVDDEDWEDLKLPPRSNLPASAIAKL